MPGRIRPLLLVGAEGHQGRADAVEGEQRRGTPAQWDSSTKIIWSRAAVLAAVLHGPAEPEPPVPAHAPDVADVGRLLARLPPPPRRPGRRSTRGVRPSALVVLWSDPAACSPPPATLSAEGRSSVFEEIRRAEHHGHTRPSVTPCPTGGATVHDAFRRGLPQFGWDKLQGYDWEADRGHLRPRPS